MSGPPKEAISRIEVLFGPQSALYGPDASQGLLNVITKHPMQESKNEINFSISSLNDPRIGGRYVKNFEKLSIGSHLYFQFQGYRIGWTKMRRTKKW